MIRRGLLEGGQGVFHIFLSNKFPKHDSCIHIALVLRVAVSLKPDKILASDPAVTGYSPSARGCWPQVCLILPLVSREWRNGVQL